ncbi:MAG: hypothetical protein RBU45_08600 [Myxococcota bacterium]|jgi:hypothetical protein|nr:hypothetical protein [Myxococcota bacterium]
MDRVELREVLDLVKDKLSRDAEAACGILWSDAQPTTRYAVGEEDGGTTRYAVGEEDATTLYGLGEEDGTP